MNAKNATLLYFLILFSALAQSQQAPGHWRVHLPYAINLSVTAVGSRLYCGSSSGIFYYNTDDGSVERLSKATGLSDVEVSLIQHHETKNLSVVIYANGNIDILDHASNTILNIPDVLQKSIIGKKSINGIFFDNNIAYLACSFGIVVIDLDKKQVIDSYQNIGQSGAQVEVSSVCVFNNRLFAFSPDAIYSASLDAPNLSDYNFWFKNRTSTKSSYNAVFNSKLYAVLDGVVQVFDGTNWTPYTRTSSSSIQSIKNSAGKLLVVSAENIVVEDKTGAFEVKKFGLRNDAVIDSRGFLAMVDGFYGLTIERPDLSNVDYIIPNGPTSKTLSKMLYANGKLWVTGGYTNDVWSPLMFNNSKFYALSNNTWFNYTGANNPLIESGRDFLDIRKNPNSNATDLYISSYGTGVYHIVNDQVTELFDEKNSSLQRLQVPDTSYHPVLSGGMDFDDKGNLWISNFGVSKPISVKTPSGWQAFSIGSLLDNNELGWLTTDDYNNVWVLTLKDKGILVYNHNGTPLNPNDDSFKLINNQTGNGALPSNTVYCATKDLRGEMWIGTSQGLAIISNPGNIFNTKKYSYDATQIIIQVGTNFEIFLGKENINCIKVDPANRKWIGTRNGAWLVSPDGYTVIKNFTTSNSPLLSNNVLEIGLDESTGEVFFGTEKGIISYAGDATGGAQDYNKVQIFPNPVRPDFDGPITIRGLITNSTVKITDISGNLVAEITSNGGTATWDGRNFHGKRVATGVYLVFSAHVDSEQGTVQSHVGKILFIH